MILTRRKSITYLFRAGVLAAGGSFAYGSLIERKSPVVEKIDCRLPSRHRQLDGLSIAVLSDFHHDEFQNNDLMGGAIDMVNQLSPDLVMLTGDYISHDLAGLEALTPHLSRLTVPMGTYAVLGNHDQWTDTSVSTRLLENDGGVTVLNNANRILSHKGHPFAIAGLESAWGGQPDFVRMNRDLGEEMPILLGWHEPDPFDSYCESNHQVILQMSGHTHGGQVRAPVWGAIKTPAYGKKYIAGLYSPIPDGPQIYVNRGIGSMGIPVRFLCPPEISLITFRGGEIS